MPEYTKKIVITDELSTPKARAERLRRLRNLANLSRKEICDSDGLNVNTYKRWETHNAETGGLPLDGAAKIIERVAKAGVISTTNWLIYGKGNAPYLLPDSLEKISDDFSNISHAILQEIMLFQTHFPDAIYAQISDDSLAPRYDIGDYVAGIQHYENDMQKLIGEDCILHTQEGAVLIRHLKAGTTTDTFQLICTNPKTSVSQHAIYDVKLKSAAPISRHYKIGK